MVEQAKAKTAEEHAKAAAEAAQEAEESEKETKQEKFIAAQKEKTKIAIEDERTGKRMLTGVVQQTALTRKSERGRKGIVAGGKTEFSKRVEGKSSANPIATNNKKRAAYAN